MTPALLSLIAAYNRHDAAAAAALYTTDGEHREVAQDSARHGRDALEGSLRSFLAAFPDANWEIEGTILSSPLSAVKYRLTGVLATALGPFEPRGQQLDIRGVLVARVDEDRHGIVCTEDYWDAGTFTRQMRAEAG